MEPVTTVVNNDLMSVQLYIRQPALEKRSVCNAVEDRYVVNRTTRLVA